MRNQLPPYEKIKFQMETSDTGRRRLKKYYNNVITNNNVNVIINIQTQKKLQIT